jgi:hypothetical protein
MVEVAPMVNFGATLMRSILLHRDAIVWRLHFAAAWASALSQDWRATDPIQIYPIHH